MIQKFTSSFLAVLSLKLKENKLKRFHCLKVMSLFSNLYIAMQHKGSDMSKSLSDRGKLHFGKKSDLLEVLVHDVYGELPNFIDARLLDGAAVVHLLPTVNVSTFDE